MANPKPVFIDCDPGLDDAIALMVLAARNDLFSLRGITAVAGNQTIDKTFHNAKRLAAYPRGRRPCGDAGGQFRTSR